MLLLTRWPGQELVFTLTQDMPAGTRFKVVFIGKVKGQYRIGIDAPRSISVVRAELEERDFGDDPDGNKA